MVKRSLFVSLWLFCAIPAAFPGQGNVPKPKGTLPPAQLGTREPGAPSLDGFLIEGKPSIPLKRFAYESGYEMSVSPTGKHIAVRVGKAFSVVYNGEILQVEGKESRITPRPIAINKDYYVPLYVLEKIYPVRFTYKKETGELSAQLPQRTMKMVIRKKAPKGQTEAPAPGK